MSGIVKIQRFIDQNIYKYFEKRQKNFNLKEIVINKKYRYFKNIILEKKPSAKRDSEKGFLWSIPHILCILIPERFREILIFRETFIRLRRKSRGISDHLWNSKPQLLLNEHYQIKIYQGTFNNLLI